ncbi:hypothetical protein FRC10_011303, partial [Ceratobasidium sp. 414]
MLALRAVLPLVTLTYLLTLPTTPKFDPTPPAPVNCDDASEFNYEGHPLAFYPPLACAATVLERALDEESQPSSWSLSSMVRRYAGVAPSALSPVRETDPHVPHARSSPTTTPQILRDNTSVSSTRRTDLFYTVPLTAAVPDETYMSHSASLGTPWACYFLVLVTLSS